jgi:hypothetical protein
MITTPLSKSRFSTQYSHKIKNKPQNPRGHPPNRQQHPGYTHHTDNSYHVCTVKKSKIHYFKGKAKDELLRLKHAVLKGHL